MQVGIIGLLGIVFIALKLMGYIDWSWVWVTLPFWGGLALAMVLAVFGLFLAAAAKMLSR